MKITTDRLCLRPLLASDAEIVFNYRSRPEVRRFQSWPRSMDEFQSAVENLSSRKFGTPGWFHLGIVLRCDDHLIGDCAVRVLETDSRIAEVGIALSPDYQSRGYATESLKGILNELFTEFRLHRVFASIDPSNLASLALMERVGFRKEAHFKESLWFRDAWVDDVIYAMLAREWA